MILCVMSCASRGPGDTGPDEPDFTGFVTAVQQDGASGLVFVESHADKLVRRHVVSVTRETVIVRREGGNEQPATIGLVAVGKWLQVWFAKPVAQPPPRDVNARKIAIIPRP